jgi:hypothetical protein
MNGEILLFVAPPSRLFMPLAWQLTGTQMNSSWLELISALEHEAEDDFVRLSSLRFQCHSLIPPPQHPDDSSNLTQL